MNNYNWFDNHEGSLSFTVRHTEGDKETLIAVTDTAEKAHLIATACNGYGDRVEVKTLAELATAAEELLKPFYKQNKNGLQEWVDYEDAHRIVRDVLKEKNLLTQLYDGVVQNWKEAENDARNLNKLVDIKVTEITRLHNLCQECKNEINDLEKQVELKQLSNTTLMLENRDLLKWKEDAMIVMKDIPEIGKAIGVPLGQSIHDKILPYIKKLQDVLFPGGFLWWVHSNGWHKHSSGEYYYKSKDFHQWPPDEVKEIEDLKAEFKRINDL